MIQSVNPPISHFIWLALEPQAVNRFGAGEAADQHRTVVLALFRIGDVIEEKSFAGLFRQSSELPAHQRLQFSILVDLPMDAVKFTVFIQDRDKLS